MLANGMRLLAVLLPLGIGFPPLALAQGPGTDPRGAPAAAPAQTLCILDFNRLGGDASVDWLRRGLSDMMISAMNRLSPYQVVEREHLKQLLAEHGLAMAGVVDVESAIQQARLAQAQLLLLGNLVKREQRITIQVRLLRLSDQKILAMATWEGSRGEVLTAPRQLSRTLLGNLNQPFDLALLAGIESEIPQSIDAARAYYLGMGAFDDGQYPEALAHYLDGAAQGGSFLNGYRAVIQMYYLLGQSGHAVAFAHQVARMFEEQRRLAPALEFYLAAAEKCSEPLEAHALAVDFLERAVSQARRANDESGAEARARDALIHEARRLDERGVNGIPRRNHKTYRLLLREFTWGMSEESKLHEKIDYFSEDVGQWLSEPYPFPSVLMWLTRTQRALAKALARTGEAERSMAQYREIFDRLEFLTALPDPNLERMTEGVRTEAHFVLLDHHARTGRLIRDHPFASINRLNVLRAGQAFVRTTPHRDVDRRARTASRYPGRAHEYFDIASPEGFEIRSMTLTTRVDGLAEYSFSLPRPQGLPPQYSLYKRLQQFRFWKGFHRRKITLPPGTELVALSTGWGPAMFSNSALDVYYHKHFGPRDDADIVSWRLDFELTPRDVKPVRPPVQPASTEADRRLLAHFATSDGWSDPTILRGANAIPYTGKPRVDVYAQDWLAFSVDGDIQIHRQDDPRVMVRLPQTVNTTESEFDPSLVRTHEGGYALLWSRGSDRRNATRFVARTQDLLDWQTPQRMIFESPADTTRYTYAYAEPLERSFNACPVPGGYVMLLAQGYVRLSKDLRSWGRPQRVLPQDLLENRLIKTRDGRLWAAFETSSPELRPYTGKDWLSGFFVTDGKPYQHLCEIHLAWSHDGIQWHPCGRKTLEGQTSDLWVFPVSDSRIAIAAQFNKAFVRWLTSSDQRTLHEMTSVVGLRSESQAVLYAENARLSCVRPVFDYFDSQRPVLVKMSSKHQLENLLR